MALTLKTERDVEAKLLQPLFHDVLGYPDNALEWGRPVTFQFGREIKEKEADLVVSYDRKPVIAVEAKKPTEPIQSGVSQVDSYAFALGTPYSVVTNGRHFLLRGYYSFNRKINVIEEAVDVLRGAKWDKLIKLISFKNIISSIEPANDVKAPDEEAIKDYRRFFRRIHNAIRDGDKLDPGASFDELSKILFLKAAEDEWRLRKKSKPVLTPEMIEEWSELGKAKELINEWFRGATADLFPDVFVEHPKIELSPDTLKDVLRDMQSFHVRNGDVDIKGRAFEEFLPSQLRGKGLGQFFTPRPIVNFMAEMASISIHDVVVDFACGSGGFLIKAFENMKTRIEEMPDGTLKRLGLSRDRILEDVKSHQIFGIDAEPRAARTAKMNMLMWGDGKRVVRGNALATADFSGNPYEPAEYDPADPESGCTLILANPPFGSKEKDPQILDRYVLGTKLRAKRRKKAKKGKKSKGASQRTEILFLEKGIKLLRPEGRMLIVIPQGILSGGSYAPVRDYLRGEAEIRAIITLPTHTFVQSGVPTVNTCILYLQKYTEEKKALYNSNAKGLTPQEALAALRSDEDYDYPIFMASAEYVGYEPSGRSIVQPDEPTDLDLILKDFSEQSDVSLPEVDLLKVALTHYGEKSPLRREQTIRGTTRGLKASIVVPFSKTAERLDPPYYLFRYQATRLLGALEPLAKTVEEVKERFKPTTDDELDAEYRVLSVSSDGKVTLNEHRRGELFTQAYKKVQAGDIAYNPMRINIGSVGAVPEGLGDSLVSPDYVVFRSKKLAPDFLVDLLRSPFYKMYIDLITTGSIRDRLYFNHLKTIRVPKVTHDRQKEIIDIVNRTDKSIQAMLSRVAKEKAEVIDRVHGLVEDAARGAKGTPTDGDLLAAEDIGAATEAKARPSKALFRELAARWKAETFHLSNVQDIIEHEAYQQIIKMGQKAVPFILADLKRGPFDWFPALVIITGENPVSEEIAGDARAMSRAWIKWGKERSILK